MRYRLTLLFVAAIFLQSARAQDGDKPTLKTIKVACVGDSITAGAGIKEPEKKYPAQLQALLGDGYTVKNYGVSGRTMLKNGDHPWTKEKAFEDARQFRPDVVIIKLGTNDTKPQNWKFKEEFYGDTKSLVEAFKALDSKPKIYLCHPVPAFPGNFGIRDEVIKNEVNPLIDQVARETGCTVIDLYTALADHKDLFPDKVHPNAEGAKIMARTIYTALTGKEAPKP